MTQRVLSVLALIATLSIAACPGTPPKPKALPSDETTPSPSPSAASATPRAKPLTDKQKASLAVLRASDFTADWTATRHKKDPSEDATAREFAACVGDPNLDNSNDTVDVDGPDMSLDPAMVSSSAGFVRTLSEARRDLAAITNPKYISCFRRLAGPEFAASIKKEAPGATLAGFTVNRVRPPGTYGDATFAMRLVVTAKAGDQRISVYEDFLAILKGRCEITVIFENLGRPFDGLLARSLLDKLEARIRQF